MDSGDLVDTLIILGVAIVSPLLVLGVFRILERRLAKASASSTDFRKAALSKAPFSDDAVGEDVRTAEKRATLSLVLAIVGAPLAVGVVGLAPLLMSLVLARSSNNTLLNYNRIPMRAAKTAGTIAWIGLMIFTAACMIGIPIAGFYWMASAGVEELAQGQEKAREGEYAAAVVDFSASIEKNPRRPEPYAHRALSYVELGKTEAAMKDCDKALQLNRSLSLSYYARARAKTAMEQFESAKSDISDALRLDPAHSDSYAVRGVSLAAQGDPQGALSDFNQALKLFPQNNRAHFLRGRFHAETGNTRQAIIDLENVLKLSPSRWPIYAAAQELLGKLKQKR